MAFPGGYVVADFSDIPVTLATASGSVTVDNISSSLVDKIRDGSKPCIIANCVVTADGATLEFSGFASHAVAGGVKQKICNGLKISATGDNKLTFTIAAQ